MGLVEGDPFGLSELQVGSEDQADKVTSNPLDNLVLVVLYLARLIFWGLEDCFE